MATVASGVEIAAPAAAVWDFYFDPVTWPTWVDQFATAVASDRYPEEGGTLRWRSGRAGRGEVDERVVEHRPRLLHRIAFADPEAEGELTTRFEVIDGGTRVSQELDYRLRRNGVLARITDALFVRSQMRASLGRSLVALRAELEAGAGASEGAPP
jgi:uncharacterized protein YndB with AHSA1/START domain